MKSKFLSGYQVLRFLWVQRFTQHSLQHGIWLPWVAVQRLLYWRYPFADPRKKQNHRNSWFVNRKTCLVNKEVIWIWVYRWFFLHFSVFIEFRSKGMKDEVKQTRRAANLKSEPGGPLNILWKNKNIFDTLLDNAVYTLLLTM